MIADIKISGQIHLF